MTHTDLSDPPRPVPAATVTGSLAGVTSGLTAAYCSELAACMSQPRPITLHCGALQVVVSGDGHTVDVVLDKDADVSESAVEFLRTVAMLTGRPITLPDGRVL